MGGACSSHWEKRIACSILVGKPEGKIPLGRPTRGWEDNIETNLRQDWVVCTGSIWLRIGTNGGLLRRQ
jgi:hypothetical protein